ncbi:CopD family protein (plasmid) [Glycocaulis abyssi]|jgi:putative copper resistance protein D|uniref:CopD family protein n=1 Tax=Glycocaulis abyssi TaxID=1433403 RepID=A0ABV9NHE0_9PROT
MDAAEITVRTLQYGTGLLGAGVLAALLWAGEKPGRASRMALALCCGLLAAGALANGLIFSHAVLDSWPEVFSPDGAVFILTTFDPALGFLARTILAGLALGALLVWRGQSGAWAALALLAAALASFAWTGHAASGEGLQGGLHKASTVAHILAAAVWLGALGLFLSRLFAPQAASRDYRQRTAQLLSCFSGIGSVAVAALVITGVTNTVLVAGPGRVMSTLETAYGSWLIVKLALFAGMVGLAALNRFVLAPALAQRLTDQAAGRIRWAVLVEAGLGAGVVACVAVLGITPPHSG